MEKPLVRLEVFEAQIRDYLETQKSTNARFSLRNQARRWKVPFSTLQKLASGKRRLGAQTGKRIAEQFDVEIVDEKPPRRSLSKKWQFNLLDPHSPDHVSWLNLAILEMLKLDDFTPNAKWFASRLGIPVQLVEDILSKMEKRGLIERTEGAWRDRLGDSMIAVDEFVSTETIRQSLKTALVISHSKIDQVPYEKREHSFNLIPVTESQIPRLKRKISDLRLEFTQEAQNSRGRKDQIYSFQIGFFPVTQSGALA